MQSPRRQVMERRLKPVRVCIGDPHHCRPLAPRMRSVKQWAREASHSVPTQATTHQPQHPTKKRAEREGGHTLFEVCSFYLTLPVHLPTSKSTSSSSSSGSDTSSRSDRQFWLVQNGSAYSYCLLHRYSLMRAKKEACLPFRLQLGCPNALTTISWLCAARLSPSASATCLASSCSAER